MKNLIKSIVIMLFGLVGWGLCGFIFYIGEILFKTYLAILIHFIAAPLIFTGLSYFYFRYFNYTSPITTALIFICMVIGLDFFVVALLIEKSFEMFSSVMGTWLPFIFIFLSVFLTGLNLTDKTLGK